MKKVLISTITVLLCVLCGCKGDSDNNTIKKNLGKNEYKLYCLNEDATRLVYTICEIQEDEKEKLVLTLLEQMKCCSQNGAYEDVFEATVEVLDMKLVSERLYLYFSEEYYDMDSVREIFARAAVVRTLTQIDGINRVVFYVTEEENNKNRLIASMEATDFIDDIDIEYNNSDVKTIFLYFTNEAGKKLYLETREVVIDEKSSREKVVLEQLMLGPENDGLREVLPDGVTIISAITRDGTCYVDLDDTFLNGSINVDETIPVYAIVNSITALTGVEKVQIMINGEMGKVYREAIRFDAPLEAKKDLVADRE